MFASYFSSLCLAVTLHGQLTTLRYYTGSSLGTELQRAQGELDIATDLLDCKKPALAAKEQELRRYKREVSNWYRALNR